MQLVPFFWARHRAGESEPRPTSGSTSGTTSGPTGGPTSSSTRSPTRAPTTGPTRLDFLVFSPSRTPHESSYETSHEGVHGRAHEWTVGVHLSCFHLFCSSAIFVPGQHPNAPLLLFWYRGTSAEATLWKPAFGGPSIFEALALKFPKTALGSRLSEELQSDSDPGDPPPPYPAHPDPILTPF